MPLGLWIIKGKTETFVLMIKEDWSKSLLNVGLLDYKNKNNKQR